MQVLHGFLQEELTNLKDIPNSLAVFCLATYGEGDPTDNAMEFYEWLQNGDTDLTGLNYAVSIYGLWEFIVKKVNPQIEHHG
jgi:sulfite reductase alpha subunit-like flavoprotein